MRERPATIPAARRERLVVRELPDETLVYDLDRHAAHCLNQAAALVWKACDGTRTIPALAALLPGDAPTADKEAAVRLALEQLGTARLLSSPVPAETNDDRRVSRRELMLKTGLAASIAVVPVVSSILVPTAQAQASGPPQTLTVLLTTSD